MLIVLFVISFVIAFSISFMYYIKRSWKNAKMMAHTKELQEYLKN